LSPKESKTSDQLAFLRVHGCDEAQGYYLSKPLPGGEINGDFHDNYALSEPPTAKQDKQCLASGVGESPQRTMARPA